MISELARLGHSQTDRLACRGIANSSMGNVTHAFELSNSAAVHQSSVPRSTRRSRNCVRPSSGIAVAAGPRKVSLRAGDVGTATWQSN